MQRLNQRNEYSDRIRKSIEQRRGEQSMTQEEKKEIEKELFHDILEKHGMVEKEEFLTELLERCFKEKEALQPFYEFLKGSEPKYSYQKVACERTDMNDLLIMLSNQEEVIPLDKLIRLVRDIKDLKEEILPVGSVVDLKLEEFQNFPGAKKVEKIRVNIIHRFLLNKGSDTYFTYAGVIYPIGGFGGKDCIQFTGELFENVVFRGFGDQEEEAFVYLVKRRLLLEQNRNSFEVGDSLEMLNTEKES